MTSPSSARLPPALWALMVGNFVIGTGVLAVAGTLNDISASLNVSIPQAGQLITAGAVLMGLGAPLLAGVVAGWDRRRLLAISLLWYGLMHIVCALAPNYPSLLPLRVITMISPAIFTPQAAACVGLLVKPEQRGRAITFVFLGWSVASVMGMPLSAWLGGLLGWRWVLALVGLVGIGVSAWIWRAMPNGVRPASLSRDDWARTLASAPLMMVVGVTLLMSFGQFTLFAYFAPYFAQVLSLSNEALSLMFLWFGAFGLLGNVVITRHIDRLGSDRAAAISLGGMVLSLALWPLGMQSVWAQALVLVPWALGCFACNSAQQARLVHMAPALAPASVALNTSAIYGGQALGAALGGVLIAQGHLLKLHQVSLTLMLGSLGLSLWAAQVQKRSPMPA
jgi:predicted MFS family arabinose efflux permease